MKSSSLMRRITGLSVLFLLLGFLTGNGRAELVFGLDPLAKTFNFTGSDFGTPNSSSSGGRVDWNAPFALSNTSNASLSINSAVTADSGLSIFATSFFRIQGSASTPNFAIEIFPSTTAPQTISGTGTAVSYASFTPTQQADLESFVAGGGSFSLAFGGGFSPIQTMIVPEASTISLFAAAGLLGAAIGGRRARRKKAAIRAAAN